MPRLPRSLPLLLLLLAPAACQRLPDGSERGRQPAEVAQRMGSTELRVVYNRPSAPGRTLFGGLVPHDSIDVFHIPYPEGEDALRLDVSPRPGAHMESLSFGFPVATTDSARLELRWGQVVVPMTVRPAGS